MRFLNNVTLKYLEHMDKVKSPIFPVKKVLFYCLDILKVFTGNILDILYPKRCLICGKYGQLICYECFKKIKLVKTSLCPICHRITKDFNVCPKCRKKRDNYLDSVVVSCHYDNKIVKDLIYKFKYEGFVDLAELFGELLAMQIPKKNLSDCDVCAVPLYNLRQRIRGFNQAELIARVVSNRLNIPLVKRLERTKNTASQATLKREQRITNIQNAFRVISVDNTINSTVILVDDVASTCSTLNACAKILKTAGYRRVVGCVIARNI